MTEPRKQITPAQRVWRFFSGYGLCTTLLVLLGVETWLATLEMVDNGLLATLKRYFHWTAPIVIPEINGKSLFLPLPGGYWVCVLLLVNLVCGGLINARKSWSKLGVLLSHFAIIFMIAAGGIAQWQEQRGVMFLFEGDQADYAVSLTDPSLELYEVKDGEIIGPVRRTKHHDLRGLGPNSERLIRFGDLPFQLEVAQWLDNAAVVKGENGWGLRVLPPDKEGEMQSPGCLARIVPDGRPAGPAFVLAVPPVGANENTYPPKTFEVGGRTFGVRLVKETIPVPYTVKLDKAVAEYYPNSMRPKEFRSEIQRISDGTPADVEISMNEPMRMGGFTFFQRTMSSGPPQPGQPRFSGFEVVSNPADKWPEWSLYLVTLGLLIHFGTKFFNYLRANFRAAESTKSS